MPLPPALQRTAFGAMGTTVEVLVAGGGPSALDRAGAAAAATFARFEAALSRFRADSALARLNARAGQWVRADPLLWEAVAAALRWARRFPGRFDPTVLPALRAAGYDRTFPDLPPDRPAVQAAPPAPAPGPRAVRVDRIGRRLRLAPGTALDLGGLGKGLAADAAVRAAAAAAGEGVLGVAVNAGGDVAAVGCAPDGPWRVAVPHPWRPEEDLTVAELVPPRLALATSSTLRRRWHVGGEERHHLIDPRTGRPARSPLVQCSVVARSAAAADVLAKVLVVGGPGEAEGHLARCRDDGAAAIAVSETGRVLRWGDWPEAGGLRGGGGLGAGGRL
jgi:thiamine biosynthesis lipoprotein